MEKSLWKRPLFDFVITIIILLFFFLVEYHVVPGLVFLDSRLIISWTYMLGLLFTFSPFLGLDDYAFYSDWTLTACDAQFVQTDRLDYIPPLISRDSTAAVLCGLYEHKCS